MLSVVFMLWGCKNNNSSTETVKTIVNNSGHDIMLISIGQPDIDNAYEVWTHSWNIVLKDGEKYSDIVLDEFLISDKIDLRLYMNGLYIPDNLGDRSPLKKENFVPQKSSEAHSDIELVYTFTVEDYQNALKQ